MRLWRFRRATPVRPKARRGHGLCPRGIQVWAVEPWCTLRMLAIAVKKPLTGAWPLPARYSGVGSRTLVHTTYVSNCRQEAIAFGQACDHDDGVVMRPSDARCICPFHRMLAGLCIGPYGVWGALTDRGLGPLMAMHPAIIAVR